MDLLLTYSVAFMNTKGFLFLKKYIFVDRDASNVMPRPRNSSECSSLVVISFEIIESNDAWLGPTQPGRVIILWNIFQCYLWVSFVITLVYVPKWCRSLPQRGRDVSTASPWIPIMFTVTVSARPASLDSISHYHWFICTTSVIFSLLLPPSLFVTPDFTVTIILYVSFDLKGIYTSIYIQHFWSTCLHDYVSSFIYFFYRQRTHCLTFSHLI